MKGSNAKKNDNAVFIHQLVVMLYDQEFYKLWKIANIVEFHKVVIVITIFVKQAFGVLCSDSEINSDQRKN